MKANSRLFKNNHEKWFQTVNNMVAGVEEIIGHKGTNYWTVCKK